MKTLSRDVLHRHLNDQISDEIIGFLDVVMDDFLNFLEDLADKWDEDHLPLHVFLADLLQTLTDFTHATRKHTFTI